MLITPSALARRALAALAVATLAGCGEDEPDTAAVAEPIGTPVATTASGALPADAVNVTASDYHFEGLPDVLDAGDTIMLHNSSTKEIHELVLLPLADNDQRTLDELLALPMAEFQTAFAGPPALVAVAPPGQDGFVALGNATIVTPGRYAVLCFIPLGADPQAYLDALEAAPGEPPSVPGGGPHFTAGMAAIVEVH